VIVDISNIFFLIKQTYDSKKSRWADVVSPDLANIINIVINAIVKLSKFAFKQSIGMNLDEQIVNEIRVRSAVIEMLYNSIVSTIARNTINDDVVEKLMTIQSNFSSIVGLLADTKIAKTIADEISKIAEQIRESLGQKIKLGSLQIF